MHVQLHKTNNHWELSASMEDARHEGRVVYGLQIGMGDKRILTIQSDDGEDYELVSDAEWKELQASYPNEGKYITEDMAIAFGFMPKHMREQLALRWEAIKLLVTPTMI